MEREQVGNRAEQAYKKDVVTMVGLDFGSTTSSAIVAHAPVGRSSTTGKMTFGNPKIVYRSEPVFTPFRGSRIDEIALHDYLDQWLQESRIVPEELFSGGAIITGLATEKQNAGRIAQLVKKRVGETIIATASDPCLESWLAFMGSCSALSRCNPDRPIINLDIGGGTTNPALGQNGNVLATGCYFIGARHFQFEPGTYRLTAISDYGRILMQYLGIHRKAGEPLSSAERDAILDFYLAMLEAVVCGDGDFTNEDTANAHTQVPLAIKKSAQRPAVTFSGGVGELIYQYAANSPLPGTTYYGDLGIDLAIRIAISPLLSTSLTNLIPENMGRATVYGLAIHSTEISGSTLFLPKTDTLPLRDLPIVGRITMEADDDKIRQLLALTARSGGGAIQILSSFDKVKKTTILQGPNIENRELVKNLGQKISDGLQALEFSPDIPLVLLAPNNFGKSLGNYATNWRKITVNLIVIDEIPDRNAHFVNIGRIHNNIVPVSFYGVR